MYLTLGLSGFRLRLGLSRRSRIETLWNGNLT